MASGFISQMASSFTSSFTSSFISRNAGQQQMLTQHIRISTISTSNGSVDCTDVVLDHITKEKKMNRIKSITNPLMWFMALLLAAFVAGCGGSSGSSPAPLNPPPPPGGLAVVNLLTAGDFAILAGAAITCNG